MYSITKYSYEKAKQLGVKIKPSKNTGKKIDVYKNGVKVASVGNIHYKDFPNYLKQDKDLAIQRRHLYKLRHEKDRHRKGSAGYYADQLLW
jgi:hypothetical protein